MVSFHSSGRYTLASKAITKRMIWNRVACVVSPFVKSTRLRISLYIVTWVVWGIGIFFLLTRHAEAVVAFFLGLICLSFSMIVFRQTSQYYKYVFKKKSAVHIEQIDPFAVSDNTGEYSISVRVVSTVACNNMLFQEIDYGNISMQVEYQPE